MQYKRVKVREDLEIWFALISDDGLPSLFFPFSSDICDFSKKDWDDIRKFISKNYSKLLSFAIKQHEISVLQDRKQRKKECDEMRTKEKEKTSPGYVYLILSDTGHFKIGKARNIDNRILQLETGLPVTVQLVGSFQSNYYSKAEKHIHNYFSEKHIKGEWFDLSKQDIEEFCAIQDYELDYLFKIGTNP